jgi:hypothetical protein
MTEDRRTALSVSLAFWMAVVLTAATLLLCGTGPRGVDEALGTTARLAFVFFLPAYIGGALLTMFGPSFLPLAKHGRDLALVAKLCIIGSAPGRSTFIFFGTAEFFVFLLAVLSLKAIRRFLHPVIWWAVRLVGMNLIAYAFYIDLSRDPFDGGLVHGLYYAPFLLSLMIAALCRLVASSIKILRRWQRPQLL